jgi:hypothetical protein
MSARISSDHRRPPAVAIAGGATALVAFIQIVMRPNSSDAANQRFRSALFGEVGPNPWNNRWYGGHHTPSYSLLSPPLTWVFGGLVVGLVTHFVSVLLWARVVDRANMVGHLRRTGAIGAFAVTAAAPAVIGQSAYALGVLVGLGAVWAWQGDRVWLTLTMGCLAALASPAAGVFVGCIGGGLWLAGTARRSAAAMAAGPAATFAAVSALFPEGGEYYPYSGGGAAVAMLCVVLVAAAGWRFVHVRWMVGTYAVLVVATIVGLTGMGHIASRLTGLMAAPAMVLMARWRTPLVIAVATALIGYQWAPATGTAFAVLGPVRSAEAFQPLADVVARYDGVVMVEVVPLRAHDESEHAALQFPIARGWHRHIDRRDNILFYDGTLTAATYQDWLVDHGVTLVAIADVRLDYGGTAERDLLEDPPGYLVPVYRDDVWRVFEVSPRPRLASEPATMTGLDGDSFTLQFSAAGSSTVKIHFSPWFTVDGQACVAAADDGWTEVRASAAGTVTVRARLSLAAVVDRDGTC